MTTRTRTTTILLGAALAFLGAAPAAAQEDVESCFEARLSDVASCEVEVLETGGLFCPGDAEIRDRVCERMRGKEGEVVDVECEGAGECTGVDPISGTVTRTFELSRQKATCSVTFRLTVRATLAGTGSIGRCAGGGGS